MSSCPSGMSRTWMTCRSRYGARSTSTWSLRLRRSCRWPYRPPRSWETQPSARPETQAALLLAPEGEPPLHHRKRRGAACYTASPEKSKGSHARATNLYPRDEPWGQHDELDDAGPRAPGAADRERHFGCPGPGGPRSAPPDARSRRDQADHRHLGARGKRQDLVAPLGAGSGRVARTRRADPRRSPRAEIG